MGSFSPMNSCLQSTAGSRRRLNLRLILAGLAAFLHGASAASTMNFSLQNGVLKLGDRPVLHGVPDAFAVVPDDSGGPNQGKRITLGTNQKIAREVLGEPLRKSHHIGKDGAPRNRPCIPYDDAVDAVAERMPTDAGHRKSRAKTAISGLISKGILGMKGDWLWDADEPQPDISGLLNKL